MSFLSFREEAKQLENIINSLKNTPLNTQQKKRRKHTPLAENISIQDVLNDRRERSYSLFTIPLEGENKNGHKNIIIDDLKSKMIMLINHEKQSYHIKMLLYQVRKPIIEDIRQELKDKYNVDYEEAFRICFSNTLGLRQTKKGTLISNCYEIALGKSKKRKSKWNIFFGFTDDGIHAEFIKKWNENPKHITIEQLRQIILNLKAFPGIQMSLVGSGKWIETKIVNIDEPIQFISIPTPRLNHSSNSTSIEFTGS